MALVLLVKIWFDIQKREGNEFRLWNNLSNLMKECLFEPHHLKKKNIPVTKRHNTTWRLTIRSNSSAIPIPLMKTRIRQTIIVPGQNPSATETWLEVEKKNLVIIVWSPENLFPARNQTSMAKLDKLYRYKYRYIYTCEPHPMTPICLIPLKASGKSLNKSLPPLTICCITKIHHTYISNNNGIAAKKDSRIRNFHRHNNNNKKIK